MRMGARRLQFGVAVMQNKLVVVGGRDGLKTLNTVCINISSILRLCYIFNMYVMYSIFRVGGML